MISQFFINRPRFAIVIAILFLLSGLPFRPVIREPMRRLCSTP